MSGEGACSSFAWAIADVGPFDEFFFLYCRSQLADPGEAAWLADSLPADGQAVHTSAGSSPDVRSRNDLLLLKKANTATREGAGPATTALLRDAAQDRYGISLPLSGRGEASATADRIRASAMRAPPLAGLFYILARAVEPDWGRLAEQRARPLDEGGCSVVASYRERRQPSRLARMATIVAVIFRWMDLAFPCFGCRAGQATNSADHAPLSDPVASAVRRRWRRSMPLRPARRACR
jgi:hypothetical protein